MILRAIIAAILIENFSLSGWYTVLLVAALIGDLTLSNLRERRLHEAIRDLRVKLSKAEIEIERANLTIQLLNEESIEIGSGVRFIEDRMRSGKE